MKKIILSGLLLTLTVVTFAQNDSARRAKLNNLFNKASNILNSGKTTSSSLSTNEIASGLKEALTLGVQKSATKLSSPGGFLQDAAVKILLPPDVQKVEAKMRMLGFGKLVDNAVLSMNRAAEDASKSAAPIFVNAIKTMTLQDALGILKGSDTAATSYLRRSTTPNLIQAFSPIVQASLQKVNATKYWKDVFTTYNRFTSKPVETDINAYVTNRALNGMFLYVAQEEKNIRTNPAARATDLLKKVFGSK